MRAEILKACEAQLRKVNKLEWRLDNHIMPLIRCNLGGCYVCVNSNTSGVHFVLRHKKSNTIDLDETILSYSKSQSFDENLIQEILNKIKSQLTMTFLEKEIEDLIFGLMEDNKFDDLINRGMTTINSDLKYYRQLNLGSYGIADIVGIGIRELEGTDTVEVLIDVFELKKDEVNANTLFQASRYMRGIQHSIESLFENKYKGKKVIFHPYATLIGTAIKSSTDFVFITSMFENLVVYTIDFKALEGIYFNTHDRYSIVNPKLADLSNLFTGTKYQTC